MMRLKPLSRLLVAALFGICLANAGAQGVYRWLDKDGKVNYTQTSPPPSAAKAAERKDLQIRPVDSGPDLPFSTQQAAKDFPVVLYTAPDCGQACADARSLLDKRGVPYKEISVTDEASFANLKKISGREHVPVLTVGKEVNSGYQDTAYNLVLNTAGYPQNTGPLPARAPTAAKGAAAKAPGEPKGRYSP